MFRSAKRLLFPFLAVFVLAAGVARSAAAQEEEWERILSFQSDIKVNEDASMDVTETIRVLALGQEIKRGIYRDFPTEYRTRWGFRRTASFRVLGVLKDGKDEPYSVADHENGIRPPLSTVPAPPTEYDELCRRVDRARS